MTKKKEIPKEIMERINYLAYKYNKAIKSPVYSVQDLKSELVIFYLENVDSNKIKSIGGWFVSFKNHLINIQTRVYKENKIKSTLKKEYNSFYNVQKRKA